jgi:hypothetical protein
MIKAVAEFIEQRIEICRISHLVSREFFKSFSAIERYARSVE